MTNACDLFDDRGWPQERVSECRWRLGDRLRGHDETIGERLVRDRGALLPLPPAPYDACEKKAVRVSSLSLVRYRGNDYSVPTAYGHREVLVRGYVHEVMIACAADEIARHPRSYQREDFVFNPLHYLALLERKIGALDQPSIHAGAHYRCFPAGPALYTEAISASLSALL